MPATSAVPAARCERRRNGDALRRQHVHRWHDDFGGILQGDTTSLQGNITDNANVTFNQTTNGTYAGNISGTGSLTKSGTGTVTLSGTNTYSGGTTVSAGSLVGTTTSLQGAIVDNANVTFNQATNGTYAGVMSGTGNLTLSGTGTVTLSGTNTYSGGTTVSAGILQGDTTSLQGNIVDNANVTFNQSHQWDLRGCLERHRKFDQKRHGYGDALGHQHLQRRHHGLGRQPAGRYHQSARTISATMAT